ncbi:MAG: sporulation protein [Segetibacter sp.]|jgi:hypothetical protein|nr:sporulation protein [Segetibacter sp.]
MKTIFIFLLIALIACKGKNQNQQTTDSLVVNDTTPVVTPPADTTTTPADTTQPADTGVVAPGKGVPPGKVYSNKRFKDVTVEKIGTHKFRIKGKAQVFEAAFSWVVEDGHNEIKKGHEMTDAGAPAFGNFSFTVDVAKQRKNSTLHMILFEASAKDGSRQYELPILLY